MQLILAFVLAYGIALAGQAVWTGLLTINLASTASIPWSVPVMAALLLGIWRYLGGWGWPRSTAETRRHHLRANRLTGETLGWALLAGGTAVIALAGYWVVMARIVRMPGNSLPNAANVPTLTIALAIGMGALVSPILEQAGFFGYGQVFLERRFSRIAAILIIAVFYALGPHPPAGGPWWPRLVFYFLTGLNFALLAAMTSSILPGLVVHILGILAFFTLVWPYDPTRSLIGANGVDTGFWLSLAQAVLFTGLAVLAFRKLGKVSKVEAGLVPAVRPER